MSEREGRKDNFTDEQERVLYQILQNTASTEEATRRISDNLSELSARYMKESIHRDRRLDRIETRVDKHSVLISGALFFASTLLVAGMGWLFGFF